MSAETPESASDKKLDTETPISKKTPSSPIPPFEKGGLRGIFDYLEIWTAAETEKKSGRGRSSGNGASVYGIKKLRELILELAVRGKLVPQDPDDEPAGELLKRIQVEKAKLIAEGKIKKDKPLPPITDEEKLLDLPKGWEWARLQDVSDVRDGTHDTPKYWDTGFPLVTSKNLYSGILDFSNIKYISETDHLKIKERSGVNRGDILFAMIGSIGNPVIVETDIDFSIKNVALFKPYSHHLCNMHYLLKYLLIVSEKMREQASGAVQSFVSLGTIRNYAFYMPPLAEQHRIVAKVDELMVLCDQLETQHNNAAEAHEKLVIHLLGILTQSHSADDFNANWQRIAAHFDTLFTTEASIDTLKQTLLQLAVMGKLVPQDPNDEPANELLKRIQAEKDKLIAKGKIKKNKPLPPISDEEKPFELPWGWGWTRLQFVIDVRDGTHDSPKEVGGEAFSYPLVTSKDFFEGRINFDTTRRISEKDHLEISKRSLVEKYDILFSMIGGNIGNQVMVEDDRPFSIKNVALFKYYDMNLTFPLFIKKYMENLAISLQSSAVGGAQPFVALGALRNLVIALPPSKEQHRIVAKADELMTLCDQLRSRITQAGQIQKKLADAVVEQAVVS